MLEDLQLEILHIDVGRPARHLASQLHERRDARLAGFGDPLLQKLLGLLAARKQFVETLLEHVGKVERLIERDRIT